jgi:hypothetical protein
MIVAYEICGSRAVNVYITVFWGMFVLKMGQQRLPKRRGSDGGECLYHGVLGCLL